MNGRVIFQAMRNIDAQLILDAAPGEWRRAHIGKNVWVKWGALAACLCILVVGVLFAMLQEAPNNPIPDQSTPPQDSDIQPPPSEHVHAFGEWHITKEATCSEMGEETRLCSCGEKETKLIALQAHFAGAWVIEKEPVIKVPTPEDPVAREPGLMCQFCHYCGAKLDEEIIPAIGSLGLAYAVNLDGKTCTVVGIGNCIDTDIIIPPNFCGYHVTSVASGAFKDKTKITSVAMPNTLVSIEDYAFLGCTGLSKVIIPDSVVHIGAYAFAGCINLTDITFSQSLASIGSGAFLGCSALTGVTLPDSLITLGAEAFADCLNLKNITLSQNLKEIGNYAFRNCSLVTSIAIPSSIEVMGNKVFEHCDQLTDYYITDLAAWCEIETGMYEVYPYSMPQRRIYLNGELLVNVEIPAGTTSIGNCAFTNCADIINITIPKSVKSVGDYAFYGCSGLTEMIIPDGVTYIGWDILHKCTRLVHITVPFLGYEGGPLTELVEENHKTLRSVTLTNSESIGQNAFHNWGNLTSITLCEGIVTIEQAAFSGCTGLKSIVIPSSVTDIGEDVFVNCNSLQSIVFQEGVASIGSYAFYACTALKSITIPDSVESIGDSAFEMCRALEAAVLPNQLTEIAYGLFSGCESLRKIVLPDTVKRIGQGAFAGCKSLENVIIPNGVETIDGYAFNGCTSFTQIVIPDSVTYIGTRAFANCANLENVTLSNSLQKIEVATFADCKKLTSLTIPQSVTEVASGAFSGCGSLIQVENGVHYVDKWVVNSDPLISFAVVLRKDTVGISERAFYDRDYLTSITIPQGVMCIGEYTFSECAALESVLFDAESKLKEIVGWAFYNCRKLSDIALPNGLETIGSDAFRMCKSLTAITIPDSVTSLGNSAFYGCSGLKTAVIGNGVRTIGPLLFYNCAALTSVVVSNDVTSIGYSAFYGCSSLESFTIPASVISVGSGAFDGCNALQQEENGVIYVGNWAVDCDLTLSELVFREGTVGIASYACYWYANGELTRIGLPSSIKFLCEHAFGSYNLKQIFYDGNREGWEAVVKEAGWNSFPDIYQVLFY